MTAHQHIAALFTAILALSAFSWQTLAKEEVHSELGLAVDISRSMDLEEQRLQ